jgi:phosphopentomutase
MENLKKGKFMSEIKHNDINSCATERYNKANRGATKSRSEAYAQYAATTRRGSNKGLRNYVAQYKRVCVIVLDSLGVGEMPDAADYGDAGANTLGHIAEKMNGIHLPNLQKLGIGNILPIQGVPALPSTTGSYGKLSELSAGKDTTTGHWELAGIVTENAFATFKEGFPKELQQRFEEETGYQGLYYKAASGTEIIEKLGQEHVETKSLIVYTSADSVFQIAAHEETVPIAELYRVCEIARRICDDYNIGRVIARPFVGKNGDFKRTHLRKDFSLSPPSDTIFTLAQKAGYTTFGVGKTDYIFNYVGIDDSAHGKDNAENCALTIKALNDKKNSLVFTNLVDFDMLWGHRNDVAGYKAGLEEFDRILPQILDCVNEDTILFLSADHGCDPTITSSTDHTREYVPIIMYSPALQPGRNLGTRKSFADLAATICEALNLPSLGTGKSFLWGK